MACGNRVKKLSLVVLPQSAHVGTTSCLVRRRKDFQQTPLGLPSNFDGCTGGMSFLLLDVRPILFYQSPLKENSRTLVDEKAGEQS